MVVMERIMYFLSDRYTGSIIDLVNDANDDEAVFDCFFDEYDGKEYDLFKAGVIDFGDELEFCIIEYIGSMD